jgi:hypothetical protein
MSAHAFPGRFPDTRLRRTRRHGWLRRAVAETRLSAADLVWPLFVHDHEAAVPVTSMPGVDRLPIEGIVRAAGEALRLGIPAIAIFPVVEASFKTDDAAHAFDPDNLACRTVRAVKQACGDALGIVCDVALDPYTSHGHDGLLKDGEIVNDETVEGLATASGNPRFAYDAYRRFIQLFGKVALGVPEEEFDAEFAAVKQAAGVKHDVSLSAANLAEIAERFLAVREHALMATA